MPKYQKGDMWDAWDSADLFLITTNGAIKRNGALVMGKGIALQAKQRFPGIDMALGKQVSEKYGEYFLLVSPDFPRKKFGCFQVKYDWQTKASLNLIEKSTNCLIDFLDNYGDDLRVHLNFPGIGAGKLDRQKVLNIIEKLPDNVTIWEKG